VWHPVSAVPLEGGAGSAGTSILHGTSILLFPLLASGDGGGKGRVKGVTVGVLRWEVVWILGSDVTEARGLQNINGCGVRQPCPLMVMAIPLSQLHNPRANSSLGL
jgi:hypothetical protein